jgi:hypothetical protein
MLDIVSKPTAMIVNRIINESVTTKAKPLDRRQWGGGFMIAMWTEWREKNGRKRLAY